MRKHPFTAAHPLPRRMTLGNGQPRFTLNCCIDFVSSLQLHFLFGISFTCMTLIRMDKPILENSAVLVKHLYATKRGCFNEIN